MNEIVIIIPTLNEYENVKILLDEFSKIEVDVVFIDDNSKDGTSQLIECNNLYNKSFYLIKRDSKLGYASACIEGILFSLRSKYKYIVQMDADLSHSIEDLKRLLTYRNNYDVIIGSRYIKDGKIQGWSVFRKFLSYTANFTCRKLLKITLFDFTSGFRIYDQKVFAEINLKNFTAEGYSFLVEIIYKISIKNYSIFEVPILFNDRKFGYSKLDKKVIFESIINLLRIATKKDKSDYKN